MEELHNHTENAEKFKGALDETASIYQQREVKSGREQMAALHGKEKREFFREYYGKKLLAAVVIAVVVLYFIYNYVTTPENALNILAVNASEEGNEEYEETYFLDFLEQNGVDASRYVVNANRSVNVDANSEDSFNTSSVETIVTLFTAQEVDLFFADNDYFLSMAALDYMENLEDYLTEEEIAALDEDDLIYVTVQESDDEYEMEKDPDSNAGETILAGIRLSQEEGWLKEMNWYPDGFDVIVGIPLSVKNEDLALKMFREILSYGE
ncbi:MAG: hypothetical protein LUI39_02775 [Lachnospiraceae bacterium]|nr:hypothetical protein [Lachnospiraceae bacterium]